MNALLLKAKEHWIISLFLIFSAFGGGATGLKYYTGWELKFWANAAELETHAEEDSKRYNVIFEKLKIAADDRYQLKEKAVKRDVKDLRLELYRNQAEQRIYKRKNEPIPEPIFRQEHLLKESLEEKQNELNSLRNK